jgi:hypothetical protein
MNQVIEQIDDNSLAVFGSLVFLKNEYWKTRIFHRQAKKYFSFGEYLSSEKKRQVGNKVRNIAKKLQYGENLSFENRGIHSIQTYQNI